MKQLITFSFLICLCLAASAQCPDYECCTFFYKQAVSNYDNCNYEIALKKLNIIYNTAESCTACEKCYDLAEMYRKIQNCRNNANANGCPCRQETVAPPITQNTGKNFTETVNGVAFVMKAIPAGSYEMGCKDGRDTDCYADEKPAHQVSVKAFAAGETEVTQALWRAVMGANPPELAFPGCDECPVERVSWNDIQDFLKKLKEKTGKNYRLLTEEEWEYAARGASTGSTTTSYLYAGSNDAKEVAWFSENAESKTLVS